MTAFRPAFWPTVISLPALLALLALGSWQLYRLDWKLGVIAEIESRISEAPVALPAGDLDPEVWNYRRVSVSGTFDHQREIHLLAHSRRGNLGYHIITPLERSDGAGWALVNRGWVPRERKEPANRLAGQIAGEVTITGIARRARDEGTAFTPDDDLSANIWFRRDGARMAAHLGIAAPELLVEANDRPNPGGFPIGGQTRLDIPNNHLQYAITWYALAVALVVIYLLWHRRRRGEGE